LIVTGVQTCALPICEDRFRMELHALDRQRAMADSHDLAILGPCGDLEIARTRFAFDRERMVAGCIVRRRQAAEHAPARMVDAREIGRASCREGGWGG